MESPNFPSQLLQILSFAAMPCSWTYIFFLSTCIIFPHSAFSSSTVVSYAKYCSSIVPESTKLIPTREISFPELTTTFLTGGDNVLAMKQDNQVVYGLKTLALQILPDYYKTFAPGIYKISGSVYIQFPFLVDEDARRNSSNGGGRSRRTPAGIMYFSFDGFWSEISRNLCMVGSALREFEGSYDGVLKMNYRGDKNQTIHTSVVSGSLESVSSVDDPAYFDPISIISFSPLPGYKYSLVSKVISSDFGVPRYQSLNLGADKFCTVVAWRSTFMELEYETGCKEHRHCSPLGNGGGEFIGPRFLQFSPIECSDDERKMRFTATFRNISYDDQSVSIDSTVIGEASWDDKSNQLFGVACRILDPVSHFGTAVDDCTMRLSLRYPSILTIREEARVVGQLWSSKNVDDSGYFRKIGITTSDDNGDVIFPERRYEYTELDTAKTMCPLMKPEKKKGYTYPDVQHSYNMRFDMSVKNSKGDQFAQGHTTPLCVGNDLHQGYNMVSALAPDSAGKIEEVTYEAEKITTINMSYIILIYPFEQFNSSWFPNPSVSLNLFYQVEIIAEGVYDVETGHLCMVGCRKSVQSSIISRDCEILVEIDYAPLNKKIGGLTKGSIKSTRAKTDPLYFDDMVIQSVAYYVEEAKRSIWRMEFEITMILISNTLVCIFVGMQIFHVKRNPEVPSFVSILMLVVLSAGHMIPLILDYEAVSVKNSNTERVQLTNGGRNEANEVTVRLITMVALLLQIRLLQLVLTGKRGVGEIWAGLISFVMYISGGLLALLLNSIGNKHLLWDDLRCYAGLILDGFLLPQIVLNLFDGSTTKALSPVFYVGMSFVRLFPHAYNQYRTHNYPMYDVKGTYYYANQDAGFYSTALDIVISCQIIVFVVVVFLQQRHGGRCVLPQRLRGLKMYRKVPTDDIESEDIYVHVLEH